MRVLRTEHPCESSATIQSPATPITEEIKHDPRFSSAPPQRGDVRGSARDVGRGVQQFQEGGSRCIVGGAYDLRRSSGDVGRSGDVRLPLQPPPLPRRRRRRPAQRAPANIKKGLIVYFIPKDTQNPYEVIADKGGATALKELGGKVVVSSGTADTAAAQIPSIQAAIQAKADAIVIAGNDPSALCPSLAPGASGRHQGRLVRLRRHLPEPPVHQPGQHRADRHVRGRPAGQADRQHRSDRDPVGRRHRDEPERLDRLHEAAAREVPEHEARVARSTATTTRRPRSPCCRVCCRPTRTCAASSRRPRSASRPRRSTSTTTRHCSGQADPDRARAAVADEAVRPRRHGQGLRAVEPVGPGLPCRVRGSASSPRVLTSLTAGATFTAGKLGSYTVLPAAGTTGPSVVLGPPTVFDASNVDAVQLLIHAAPA